MDALESVNVSALIGAVNSCKSSLNKGAVAELVTDARALPWDGAGAKDNLVAGVCNISNQTNSLYSALDPIIGIANRIQTYQDTIKEYDSVVKDLSSAKSKLSNLQSSLSSLQRQYDSNSSSASYIRSEINSKKSSINAMKTKINKLQDKKANLAEKRKKLRNNLNSML